MPRAVERLEWGGLAGRSGPARDRAGDTSSIAMMEPLCARATRSTVSHVNRKVPSTPHTCADRVSDGRDDRVRDDRDDRVRNGCNHRVRDGCDDRVRDDCNDRVSDGCDDRVRDDCGEGISDDWR
jgi:hypothetical protein